MDKMKEVLKPKWTYKITDNQLLLFEIGVCGTSIGGILLLIGLVSPLTGGSTDVGGIKDIVLAGIVCGVCFCLLIIAVLGFHKTREKI